MIVGTASMPRNTRTRRLIALAAASAASAFVSIVAAQPPGGRGGPPPSPRDAALFDMTGQWVAVVNEDWRWRMITPPVGDVSSLPVNARAREEAIAWNLEQDRAADRLCKAFGAPGLIRQPTRIRVNWDDEDTLLLEFDAGRQTRRFEFGPPSPPSEHTLQGYSEATWFRQTLQRGVFGSRQPPSGALQVVTTHLAPGYLRPNGVPYSEEASMKEYFHTFTLPGDGGTWLVVTTVVDDPVYLTTELIMSTQFRKENARAGWNPRACDIRPPLVVREPEPPGPFG
jgi:hypothetical protein